MLYLQKQMQEWQAPAGGAEAGRLLRSLNKQKAGSLYIATNREVKGNEF